MKLSRLESGRNPAEIRPGNKISDPEALLRNIGHVDFVEFQSLPVGHAKSILCSYTRRYNPGPMPATIRLFADANAGSARVNTSIVDKRSRHDEVPSAS